MSDQHLRRALDRRITDYRATLSGSAVGRPLLTDYGVAGRIPHRVLADGLPTPVTGMDTGAGTLWVKRDDLTSSLYGGNKVRKLEYVLAHAATRGCTPVVVGATGSHHILASVLFCRLLEMSCEVVLFPQPPTPEAAVVQAVLDAYDVRVHRASTPNRSPWATARTLADGWRRGDRLCLVYPGSSSPAGTLGYVDCGLEIARAVQSGICPEPAAVYVAFGTGGTAVGLSIGLALGGLSSEVRAVQVGEPIMTNRPHLAITEWRTRRLLRSLGVDAPRSMHRISLVTAYLGEGYGHPLPGAAPAVELAHRAGLPVDQTYTAKALAAAVDHQRRAPSEHIMFLETLAATDPVSELGPLG
ncbi:MAG: 1-aminocyclopropane-1-carboxylate deaminase/D-cysteine desulfhydrase [Acidimicrobiia bacterium]